MPGKGRNYTKEFKDSAIQLVLNTNKPISQVARDLGMNDKTLNRWVLEYKHLHNIEPVKIKQTESLEEENKRLRKELAVLKQEKEILKKAAAYFAKETL